MLDSQFRSGLLVALIVVLCALLPTRVVQGDGFGVNSTGDGGDSNTADGVCDDGSGACTLRAAIEQSNSNGLDDIISFSIGSGAQTINPLSPLPGIFETITIDGTTQPGFAGAPIIELSGASAGVGDALQMAGGNSTVRGLVIGGFNGTGIHLINNGNNTIEGNYIGTNSAGNAANTNLGHGIWVEGASNNTIGGDTAGARNIISGNDGAGIQMTTAAATNNTVSGNYVGIDVTGTVAIRNSSGVFLLFGPSDNTIGGTTAEERNVISGNGAGIDMIDAPSNTILGNYIGTNAAGTAALGNTGTGIYIGSGDGNNIGELPRKRQRHFRQRRKRGRTSVGE